MSKSDSSKFEQQKFSFGAVMQNVSCSQTIFDYNALKFELKRYYFVIQKLECALHFSI